MLPEAVEAVIAGFVLPEGGCGVGVLVGVGVLGIVRVVPAYIRLGLAMLGLSASIWATVTP